MTEEIINYLTIGYKDELTYEKKVLEKINCGKAVPLTYMGLWGVNESKSWYYLFIEKDLEKTKQCFYLYGKITEYICKTRDVSMILGMTQDNTYALLSDSKDLISTMPTWKYDGYNLDIKKGSLKYIISSVANFKDQEALELLDLFRAKHRKMTFKEENELILRAIIANDKSKIEELLKFFLLPKNHKKTNGIYPLRKDILSFPAIGYAKLAWLRGVEVEIDHPLVPKELLIIKPNKFYDDTYEFLKD